MLKSILQIVYPSLCRGCNCLVGQQDVFCPPCAASIKPIVSLHLPVTKHVIMPVFAASAYVPPVRTLVVKKFAGDVGASRQLAQLMLDHTPLRSLPVDYVVPVPLHWTRYASRGFNQAHEMAKIVAAGCDAKVARLVRRVRRTSFQWQLPAKGRQQNVAKAFDLHYWYRLTGTAAIEGKHVVLVDDLCTTGATLAQVAKVIAACKPASLTAVVGCRAV